MSPTPRRARGQIWRDIHDALIGSHRDFTQGPIGRAVFLLAIPMILEMAMESLFGIVDVFFVARLGTEAVATVALTEGMLTIVFGVAMGLSMATTAMVARRTGEKDPRGAAVAAVQAIGLGIVISLAVALVGGLNAPRLLQLMGASPGTDSTAGFANGLMSLMASAVVAVILIGMLERIESSQRGTVPAVGKSGESASQSSLPDWLPAYPGSAPQGAFSMQNPKETTGSFSFVTKDSIEQVMRYYEDALKKAGLKVTSNTMQQDGKTSLGIVTGEDAGNKRKAAVNATAAAEGINVGVTFTASR